jgi:hypothetical protein
MPFLPALSAFRSAVCLSCCAAVGVVAAQDNPIVGPRALGMGGTGVSSCDDHTAQQYNPAMLGFFAMREPDGGRLAMDNNDLGRKRWGVGVDASVGYSALGNLADILKDLSGANLRALAQSGLSGPGDLQYLMAIVRAVGEIGEEGNAINASANGGMGMRIGRWGLGARLSAQSTSFIANTDLVNLAMSASGPALASRIAGSGAASDGQVALIGPEQARSLYVRLGGDPSQPINVGSEAWQSVQRVDFAMRQAGVSAATIDRVSVAVQNAVAGTGRSIEQNTTTISLAGFGLAEVPLSYGYPITENWAVGATLKGLVGRVYRNQIPVFSQTARASAEQTFEAFEQSVTVGLDLSVAARTRYVQAGLILRNLNSPSFAGPTINGYTYEKATLRPQATLSESVIPWTWLTVAIDLDLNAIEAAAPGLKQQRLGVGAEVAPWHALALRVGAYRNIAEGDGKTVATLGAGVNLWAVRIDAAIAATTERVHIDQWDVPSQMQASLGLMADF